MDLINNKYSKRLNAIASLIDFDKSLVDVGSDHGFLVSILIQNGFKKPILAVENKKGPYENLMKNIARMDAYNITTSLSSGLEKVDSSYQTIVIAGMGFSTIKAIIEKDIEKAKSFENYIIDCHTNLTEVREYFVNLGYKIEDEITIFEDEVFYDIISFKKSDKKSQYKSLELKYGPKNLQNLDKIFVLRILDEISYKERIIEKTTDLTKKETLINEISELKRLIGWYIWIRKFY